NQRAMDKARDLPCDAVVFDLEDAVAPAAKVVAREQVLAQIQAGGYGARKLVVRANSIDSPWGEDDLKALALSGIGTICLPKIDSVEQLQRCSERLADGGAPDELTLWGMIETPQGVANVEAIATSGGRLQALLMGTTDLANELRVPHRADRLGLLFALSRCVNAARMAGIVILDSVFLKLQDAEAFRADCEHGKALGFDGKTLIHPSQIEAANEVYGLQAEQVEHARRVIDVWQAALAEGKGVAVLDGKLVETMHVEDAHRILVLARSLEALQA
ncbi:MAG: CoA ester lyase, partial [Gammaproteobacteria bacterium]|nr:CoA ester lyase [Gammaproteobacteria bacterium]